MRVFVIFSFAVSSVIMPSSFALIMLIKYIATSLMDVYVVPTEPTSLFTGSPLVSLTVSLKYCQVLLAISNNVSLSSSDNVLSSAKPSGFFGSFEKFSSSRPLEFAIIEFEEK